MTNIVLLEKCFKNFADELTATVSAQNLNTIPGIHKNSVHHVFETTQRLSYASDKRAVNILNDHL